MIDARPFIEVLSFVTPLTVGGTAAGALLAIVLAFAG
jgi:hypothetical protein